MATAARFCSPDKPRCTHGHVLKIAPVICDRITRCTHRPAAGHAPHDEQLYLARLEYAGETLLIVVPVTTEQVQAMRDTPLSLIERLALLKLAVPNIELDLSA